MNIILNGEETFVSPESNLETIIQKHSLPEHSFVIELNSDIVDKNSYSTCFLKEGDTIEIIRFVGGG